MNHEWTLWLRQQPNDPIHPDELAAINELVATFTSHLLKALLWDWMAELCSSRSLVETCYLRSNLPEQDDDYFATVLNRLSTALMQWSQPEKSASSTS